MMPGSHVLVPTSRRSLLLSGVKLAAAVLWIVAMLYGPVWLLVVLWGAATVVLALCFISPAVSHAVFSGRGSKP